MEQVLHYLKETQRLLEANEFETHEGLDLSVVVHGDNPFYVEFEIFIQNIFAELDGKEYRLACHHDGSVYLEKILRHGSTFQLRVFMDRLCGKYLPSAQHRYASHVLQTWLVEAGKRFKNGSEADAASLRDAGEEEGILLSLEEIVRRFWDEMKSSMVECIRNAYGTHVVRAYVNLIFGANEGGILSSPAEFEELRSELAGLFITTIPQSELRDLTMDRHASAFLQMLLTYLYQTRSPHAKSLLNVLFRDFFVSPQSSADNSSVEQARQFFDAASQHEIGSHFIECILSLLVAQDYALLYSKIIRGRLADYLCHSSAKFVVQQLIGNCKSLGQLELIIEELQPLFGQLVEMKRLGILIKLTEWVLKHESGYTLATSSVFDAFHAKTPADRMAIVPCMLRLLPVEKLDMTQPIVAQGCSLLALIPRLPKDHCKPFADSLLALEPEAFVTLSMDASGSRVLEAFIAGSLPDKARLRVSKKMVTHYAQLACNKFGSHVVDRCWAVANVLLKKTIVEELVARKRTLEDSHYGKMVLRNCRVEEYQSKKEEWVAQQEALERKRAFFADIIDDGGKDRRKRSGQQQPVDLAEIGSHF